MATTFVLGPFYSKTVDAIPLVCFLCDSYFTMTIRLGMADLTVFDANYLVFVGLVGRPSLFPIYLHLVNLWHEKRGTAYTYEVHVLGHLRPFVRYYVT